MFWSLYNQSGSAWILQADKMDLHALGREWLPAQIHTINPILILAFIPLFSYGIYPAVNRVYRLTPLRKMGIGFFLTALAFAVSAWIEHMIAAGQRPTIYWQLLAYIILTAGEVMVSITGLEFSYTQAPASLKSVVMALWLLAVSVGSLFTWAVNQFIQNADKTSKLPGPSYYWFFAATMTVTALLYLFVAVKYRERTTADGPNPPR